MAESPLIKKMEKIRDKYTFGFDKLDMDLQIKAVRKAIVRAEMMKFDPIKDLVKTLKAMGKEITTGLANDRELDDRQRDKLFERRDAMEWMISFFETPKSVIKRAKKKVKEELKE